MGRIRSLKPEFFRSRSLAKCSREARLTFQGLWCEADDNGVGVADARILKGAIWPLDDDITHAHLDAHLEELMRTAHIFLYFAHGERYFQVRNWDAHQSASMRRGKGKYPLPPADMDLHAEECKSVQLAHKNTGEQGAGSREQGEDAHARKAPYEADFNEAWELYPRKTDRGRALRAYAARRRAGASKADLLAAVKHFAKAMADTEERFIKYGATFFGPDEPFREFVKPPARARGEPVSQSQGDMFPSGPEGQAMRDAWYAEHSRGTIKLPGEE